MEDDSGMDDAAVFGRSAICTDRRLRVPVSYTHLRAHETVLDLVCRLLLEKKNNMRDTCVIVVHTARTDGYDGQPLGDSRMVEYNV